MATTLKFAYAIILSISLFLLATNAVGKQFLCLSNFLVLLCCSHTIFILFYWIFYFFSSEIIECEVDADCPKSQVNSFVIKCIKNLCLYSKIHILYDQFWEYTYVFLGRMSSCTSKKSMEYIPYARKFYSWHLVIVLTPNSCIYYFYFLS